MRSFADRSIDNDGSIVSHLWDFGDGSPTSVETDPMHTYPGPGSYTASLTVTDDGGLSGSYSRIVRIAAPPIALVNGVELTNQSAAQGDRSTTRSRFRSAPTTCISKPAAMSRARMPT